MTLANTPEHPQAALLTVRVGVTGHREEHLEKLGADPERLRGAVRQVLKQVREVARTIRSDAEGIYGSGEPELYLISALAEGADRLIADEALALGYKLQCILPFLSEEYETDFTTVKSKEHFRRLLKRASLVQVLGGNPAKRPEAYLAAGRALLKQSNLLLALWDGAPSRGVGGTAQVVEKSRQMGIPVLWVDARPHTGHLLVPSDRPDGSADCFNLEENLTHFLRSKLLPIVRPQAAQLALRIGIVSLTTGNLENLEQQSNLLHNKIWEVLARIGEIAQEALEEPESLYARKKPALRLISSLTQRLEQLVAEKASTHGYELQCVLPCPREEYGKCFPELGKHFQGILGQARKVIELGGNSQKRQEADLAAYRVLLLQCDVLIAISDGAHARESGGTHQVLKEALQLEIPTVSIDIRSPHSAILLSPGSRPEDPPIHDDLEELDRRLEVMLRVPEPDAEHRQITERERMLRFLGERQPRWNFEWPFQVFRHLLSGQWKKLFDLRLRLPDFSAEAYKRRNVRWNHLHSQEIEQDYLVHFDWADNLAKSYAGRYRSSFLLAYLLGAFAVLVAFLGVDAEHLVPGSKGWFISELVLISLILAVTIIGRQKHWHERWMDCRLLAEALRQMEFLAPIGRVPAAVKVPTHLEPSDPRRSWFNWHFRALVRQAGLVGARLDRGYLSEYRKLLHGEIGEQAQYHRENFESLERVHHRLHLVAQLLFVLAAIACFLHVFPLHRLLKPVCAPTLGGKEIYERFLSFCAIALPAFGAAFGAIHHNGEFERLALRSRSLAERLEKLKREAAVPTPDLPKLSRIADEFSLIMMSELVDWRFVFLDKDLVLPA